ncbi:MAG: hypothetical protein ABI151_18755, partial [Chitinophagaceae bacterium]
MKIQIPVSILLVCLFSLQLVSAQFPYKESFKNASASGVVISGAAKLTAATGVDPIGQGYLRLTDNVQSSVGYIYAQDSFPSNYGLTSVFEFFTYKPGASGFNQADGISFFLFDASVNSFRPGGIGGSLGYAQYYSTPGMAKGYLGISIDEYGNFSSATDGIKNGGPGQTRGSVAIRGPGNGRTASDYVYHSGIVASDPPFNSGFAGFTQRYPDSTSSNYRRLQIILTPGSSLGINKGYRVTVKMFKGGTPVTAATLMNNLDYPFIAPAKLQYGMAASTGSITDFHEIRNVQISPTNLSSLINPTANSDVITACPGQPVLLDVSSNDTSANIGGSINKSSIDLDPSSPGKQVSFTDPGKGIYTVDGAGIVTFTPLGGFTGVSVANYTVLDNYGFSSAPSSITVTINAGLSPSLAISNPAAVCSPATINIANPALRNSSTTGAVYDYFKTVNDAYNNTNNINASSGAINQEGIYYIRANLGGCYNVKPVVVEIASPPTTANAGTDQNNCNTTGLVSATLLGNNPDIGSGNWTQISGPSTATITYPEAATSPVNSLQNGVYVFRWTISNGACASSTDDVQLNFGLAAAAGAAQTVCNSASATLQGNSAGAGTGTWTQVSGPAITIPNPANPQTMITGLTTGSTYVLNWRIITGGCNSSSQVSINNLVNTISDAGPDQTLDMAASFTLAGNNPATGNTGTWSLQSSP